MGSAHGYDLFDEIGRGGVAVVRLGVRRSAGGFRALVACKRLHPEHEADPTRIDMMVDEARLAARLRHPNVVPVEDVLEEGDAITLVMPFVRGIPLTRLGVPGDAACPPAVAVAIASDVLAGLDAAHALESDGGKLDVVHRDVSPSNILVGAEGHVWLTDFGIAKHRARLQRTRAFELKGKIGYMAPEQLEGRGDARVDVYATAVVLWELLVGRSLFEGADRNDVAAGVLSARVIRPSKANPDVPRALDGIVLRGLERNEAHRFPTAREMRSALEAAVPRATSQEVGRWAREHGRAAFEALDAWVARAEGRTTGTLRTGGAETSSAPSRDRRPRRQAALACGVALLGLLASGAVWLQRGASGPGREPVSRHPEDGLASTSATDAPGGMLSSDMPPEPSSRAASTTMLPEASGDAGIPMGVRSAPPAGAATSRQRKAATTTGAAGTRACEVRAWMDGSGKKHYSEVCR